MSLYADTPVVESGCSCTPETCACESNCCTTTVSATPASEDTISGVSCETQAFHMEMVLLLTKGILEPTLYTYKATFSSSHTHSNCTQHYTDPSYAIFHPPSPVS